MTISLLLITVTLTLSPGAPKQKQINYIHKYYLNTKFDCIMFTVTNMSVISEFEMFKIMIGAILQLKYMTWLCNLQTLPSLYCTFGSEKIPMFKLIAFIVRMQVT